MVLPENLTTLASDSEANRLYHQEIDVAVPWLALPTSITAGTTAHLTHHQALHDAIDRGLRKGALDGVTGHGAAHNIVHGYVNTTYQNELHVTKGGSDANPGTWASPKLTIGAAITAALSANASGQTTRIRVHATSPGTTTVYREQLTIGAGGTTAAMVLEAAEDGVVVSGADDWTTGWTASDAPNRIYWRTWTNNWGVQAWPAGWADPAAANGWTDIIRRRELVVIDGVWVRQVLTLAELTSYTAAYFVDEAADRLYVRLPSGATANSVPIDVGLRERCLEATSRANLTIRGLVFRHAVPLMQNAGVVLSGCTNPTVEDVSSHRHSWGSLGVNLGTGGTMRRVDASDGGVLGGGSFRGQGQLWEDCTFHRNNTFRGAWANYKDWEDGGIKHFNARSLTMRRCDAYDDNGPGLWWDTDCKDVLLEDCRAARSTSNGIFGEYSQGPVTLRRCKVNDNFRGVSLTSSRNVTIDDCDIWDNGIEVQAGTPAGTNQSLVEWDTGATVEVDPANWTYTNNLVWASSTKTDKFLGIDPPDYTNNTLEDWRTSLVASGNAYHSTVNTTPFMRRNADNTKTAVNFTDWKTYLGGTRDSTSTFSSTAPSPAPTL